MLRLILVALFLISFFIWSLVAFLVEIIIGKFNKHAKDISSLRIVQWAFKAIRWLSGVKTEVIGYENVPKDKPVLFVGNHNSYFDVIILYSMTPGLTGFVAKKEIEKVPLLRVWMRFLYCLFLDRKNTKEGLKTILQGIEYVKKGISIVIFPEGTRNTTDEDIQPFKEGSLKFAEKTGCAIIPVTQNNTRNIWEAHMPWIKAAHTTIEFGKPIYIKELGEEDRKFPGAYVQNVIVETYRRNREKYE